MAGLEGRAGADAGDRRYGQFALILALFLAISLSIIPLLGTYTGNELWMRSSRSMATGLFVFVCLAFIILTYSFIIDDFSVKYVANHSNSLLPVYYKFSAVWGGHEGSLLLWVLVLSTWILAVSQFSRALPIDMLARVLSIMAMIAVGFLLFTLFTSNPFERVLPNIPSEGSDLNPLLQDPGLIFHPPMLYMGYVGFSVVFAFAIAALLSGRLDSAWARWSRPWTNAAWAFLTLGIALGSWWAYYELGWGGWWFWDPVENASFMPWLVGTALIHSLAVTEKRGVFKSWTILLAIFAFSLSLLGTFLVRSGVLTSVHAFATDPTRGLFILIFLAVVVGGSLLIYAMRAPVVKSLSGFSLFSRESFLLANNIILLIAAVTVLLGTLYPLISDAFNWGKVSVGAPYFNAFFAPLMCLLTGLMGIGIMLNWKNSQLKKIAVWLWSPAGLALFVAVLAPLVIDKQYRWSAVLAIIFGAWVIFASLSDLLKKSRHAPSFRKGLRLLRPSYYGMITAHIGIALTFLGASLNTIYSDQQDLRLDIGQSAQVAGLKYQLNTVSRQRGPNYTAQVGEIFVFRNNKKLLVLEPEKRQYLSGGNIMTEAAIDAGFFRDLYVALGEQVDNNAWAVRVHYKPFVRWIWLGAIFMAFGSTLAVIDKRYRVNKSNKTKTATELLKGQTKLINP